MIQTDKWNRQTNDTGRKWYWQTNDKGRQMKHKKLQINASTQQLTTGHPKKSPLYNAPWQHILQTQMTTPNYLHGRRHVTGVSCDGGVARHHGCTGWNAVSVLPFDVDPTCRVPQLLLPLLPVRDGKAYVVNNQQHVGVSHFTVVIILVQLMSWWN